MPTEISKHEHVEELTGSPCIKCSQTTNHQVMSRVIEHYSDNSDQNSFHATTYHEVIRCCGCEAITYRSTSTNSEDMDGDMRTQEQWCVETIAYYPPRGTGRREIQDSHQLPPTVLSIYKECLAALNSGLNVVAAIAMRALLEEMCAELSTDHNNLVGKIGQLKDRGLITEETSKILHKIREIGNGAAHERYDFGLKPLTDALIALEHTLTGLYIIPKYAGDLPAWERKGVRPMSNTRTESTDPAILQPSKEGQ